MPRTQKVENNPMESRMGLNSQHFSTLLQPPAVTSEQVATILAPGSFRKTSIRSRRIFNATVQSDYARPPPR